MKVSFGTVDGNQWEGHTHRVLKLRYREKHTHYIPVPARFRGDLGIEGFSKDGDAFQCYCPPDAPPASELYKNQRDKITTDIKKLIKNQAKLITLLGGTKIKRWYFVTPKYENKDLIAHCAKKTQEIRSKSYPHIDTDFEVLILTEEDFLIETRKLNSLGLHQVDFEPPVITTADVIDWKTAENDLYNTISDKISKIPKVPNKDKYVENNIKRYLAGQSVLSQIRKDYPELHEKLLSIKTAQEKKVEDFSLLQADEPSKVLKECYEEYERLIANSLEGAISPARIKDLTAEAIADWLIRCPLDF